MERTQLQSKIGSVWVDVDESATADLVYFYLNVFPEAKEAGIVKRTQRLTDHINLDFDANNRLIGIEVI